MCVHQSHLTAATALFPLSLQQNDAGWRSNYMSWTTPNIDRLVQESVLLENFYTHEICTPTRGALMTGRFALRLGQWDVNLGELPLTETTLAQELKSAGYRIGPSEIENCLVKHPAVVNAAVVPKPDRERGALVKAYVVLALGFEASDALVQALQTHVRGQLAPYEYPKEIEFTPELPMTTTGKVQRRVLRLQEEARAKL